MSDEKSPNKEIDKSIKDLMKEIKGEIIPENVTAKVRVLQIAIQWEKVKHHIRDQEEFDPNNI